MDHETALVLLGRLHAAQNDFYAGGEGAALHEVLTADIRWHVPGRNAIAGDHRGIEAVLGYFARRRDIAGRSFRMSSRGVLSGAREWVASITDGKALLGGRDVEWSTVGLYRLRAGRIAECWLLPLDPVLFDRVWGSPSGRAAEPGPVSSVPVRVTPRLCDAQGMVHASRYYEFFEDAFLGWLDEHVGGYAALRSAGADLVVVASGCDHRGPAAIEDRLSIEARPAATGRTSLSMSFTVRRDESVVAVGRTTYVAVSPGTPGAIPLPAPLLAAVRP